MASIVTQGGNQNKRRQVTVGAGRSITAFQMFRRWEGTLGSTGIQKVVEDLDHGISELQHSDCRGLSVKYTINQHLR